jgi:hypothetical protein
VRHPHTAAEQHDDPCLCVRAPISSVCRRQQAGLAYRAHRLRFFFHSFSFFLFSLVACTQLGVALQQVALAGGSHVRPCDPL